MSKEGMLLAEEVLKVILAILAIGILAFLLFSLYQKTRDSRDMEFAQQTLDFLAAELQTKHASVDIYNPEGWNLNYWPQEKKIGSVLTNSLEGAEGTVVYQRPLVCYNNGWQQCICICKENDKSTCDKNGYCINNQGYTIPGDNIDLSPLPLNLTIDHDKREITG